MDQVKDDLYITMNYASPGDHVTEIRGRTDKKLTSMLVIQTFFKFRSGRYFLKVWESFIFQKIFKNSDFHPHCQRRRKHDPLDPERHDYTVYPPERLHFLCLSLHRGITSVCSISGETFPC